MLPEPDLFQCGTPTCGTLGRRRRELEEADRSPGQTVLGPENQQLTLSRGMLNHLEQGGGQATLMRGRKPVQVYSSLLAPATANTVMAEQERAAAGLAGSGRRWHWQFFFTRSIVFSRWYLLVIVLLYIGLITSFCLNVTLLVRREPERVVRLEEMARTGTGGNIIFSLQWNRTVIGLFLVGWLVREMCQPNCDPSPLTDFF